MKINFLKRLHLLYLLFFFGSCSTNSNQEPLSNLCGTERIERRKSSLNDSLYYIGKQLFTENCAPCHSPNTRIIGFPFQRIRDDYGEEWTLNFIRNNDSLQKQGDIRSMYDFKFRRSPAMPTYKHLSDNEIKSILDYVDSFEYIEISDGHNYYAHRKLSVNSMKDSLKSIKVRNE